MPASSVPDVQTAEKSRLNPDDGHIDLILSGQGRDIRAGETSPGKMNRKKRWL
jgi:hypothetical protein